MPSTARLPRQVAFGCASPAASMRSLVLLLVVVFAGAASVPGATIAFLGDSLTAGYGLAQDEAYPALIGRRLAAEGLDWQVVNAGESGDTTKGGRSRLDWMLRSRPQVVVVALGANDGLRGLEVARTEANLQAIIDRLHREQIQVVLCGMLLPRNFGPEYTQGFRQLFRDLAARNQVGFYPFLLDGVATRPDLNLADGVHPNAQGQAVIAERLADFLAPLLRGERQAHELQASEPQLEAGSDR